MDNIELLKTLQEIHKKCECNECPLDKEKNLCSYDFIGDNAEEIIEICEQWIKDHPVKTYADVFFEQFPNAKRYGRDSRVPTIVFTDIYGGTFLGENNDVELWLQPYPEDKKWWIIIILKKWPLKNIGKSRGFKANFAHEMRVSL